MAREIKPETKESKAEPLKYIILMRTDDRERMEPSEVKTVDKSRHPSNPSDEKAVRYYPATPAEHLNFTDRFQAYNDSGYISTFEFKPRDRNERDEHFFFAYTPQRKFVHFIIIPEEAYGAITKLKGEAKIEKDDNQSDSRIVRSGDMIEPQIYNLVYPQLFSTDAIDIKIPNIDRMQYEILLGGNWSKYALCRSYPNKKAVELVNKQKHSSHEKIVEELIKGEKGEASAHTPHGEDSSKVKEYVDAAKTSRKQIFLKQIEGIVRTAKSALDAELARAAKARGPFRAKILQVVEAAERKMDQERDQYAGRSGIADIREIEKAINEIQREAAESPEMKAAIRDSNQKDVDDFDERQKKRENEALEISRSKAILEVQQMIDGAPTFELKNDYIEELNELLEGIKEPTSDIDDIADYVKKAKSHKEAAERRANKEMAILTVQQMIDGAPTFSGKEKYISSLEKLLGKIKKETKTSLLEEHLVRAKRYEGDAKERAEAKGAKKSATDSKDGNRSAPSSSFLSSSSSSSSGSHETKKRKHQYTEAQGGGGPALQGGGGGGGGLSAAPSVFAPHDSEADSTPSFPSSSGGRDAEKRSKVGDDDAATRRTQAWTHPPSSVPSVTRSTSSFSTSSSTDPVQSTEGSTLTFGGSH
jgi:hypothetical protein